MGLLPSFATSTEYWKNVLSRLRRPDAWSGTLGSLEPPPEGESLSAFMLESIEGPGPIFSHLYLRIATPGGISSFRGAWAPPVVPEKQSKSKKKKILILTNSKRCAFERAAK